MYVLDITYITIIVYILTNKNCRAVKHFCHLVDGIFNYWVILIFHENDDFVVILFFVK